MDISAVNKQHAAARAVQNRILKWSEFAKLGDLQIDVIGKLEELNTNAKVVQKVNKKFFFAIN